MQNLQHLASNHKLSGIQRSKEYSACWGEQPVTRTRPRNDIDDRISSRQDIVTVITFSYVWKLDERLCILNRDMEDKKMTQIKLLKIKILISEIKNIVDRINRR